MSDLIPFTYSDRPVRAVQVDGEPWFVAADVCAVLGYANGRAAVEQHVPDKHRGSVAIHDGTPGNPNRALISEAGLYRLIMRSNAVNAEMFQEWVTAEVLPAIRKTGRFAVDLSNRDLARMVIEEADRADGLAHQVAVLTPSAASWDRLAESVGDYSLRDAAQILDRDPAIKTGQNRLAAYLREIAWCSADGRPYQRHVEAGRLVLRSRTYEHPVTGESTPTTQVRITPKGLGELHRLMGGSAPLADTQLALVVSA